MKNKLQLELLLQKYVDGTCSEHEKELVESWYIDFVKRTKNANSLHLDEDKIKYQAFSFIQNNKTKPKEFKLYKSSKIIAAAMLLCISTFGIWYYHNSPSETQSMIVSQLADISPGGNRAKLTLSDGTLLELDESQKGLIIGDQLLYFDGTPLNIQSNASELQWIEIQTPRGGNYQITLSDGSEVWLNAASKIRYPMIFSESERRVELQGEAYFHVTSVYSQEHTTKLPFIVETPRQEIRVLGTQFNVSDYHNEDIVRTTLVEGKVSVKVNNAKVNNQVLLYAAGQQSVLQQSKLSIEMAELDNYIAWKDGVIVLDNTEFSSLIKQLERWYNVDFVFKKSLQNDLTLSGRLPRNSNLSGILNALTLNTGLKFLIQENKVIVE